MNKFDECQKPFSPCWCSVAGRENNPHCKNVPSVPINNPIFIFISILFATVLFIWVRRKQLKLRVNETK